LTPLRASGSATAARRRAGLIGVAGLAALLLAFPSASSAAVRYAAPGASGAEPCNPTPCSLSKAINNAKDGDQVIVAGGEYKLGAEIEITHAVDVGGQPGAALPVVKISENFIHEKNAGARVHDLRIEVVKATMPFAITDESGTVERVFAVGLLSAGACEVSSGTIRDSVCWGDLDVSGAGSSHVVLRNVTATTTVIAAGSGANLTVDGSNLIMHSISPTDADGADLAIDVSAGSSAKAVFAHSNYAGVNTSLSSGTNFSYTAPGTNGNQTAPPLFVDAASGNLHELAGSPTIDAGVVDPLLGSSDLEGAARSQPSCIGGMPVPDIGAYEFAPTAACPKPSVPSNQFKFGKLKRNKKKGTASLAILVPGPGSVALDGKGIGKQHAAPHGVETVKLAVKCRKAACGRLRAQGRLKVRVAVTYAPVGGEPSTRSKTVKLILRG
jgi:hypothetical protein